MPRGCRRAPFEEAEGAGTPLHSGKIAYWMYQMYCTTGIQKW